MARKLDLHELGDVAAVTSMLDRILHHGQVLKRSSPRSWRTKAAIITTGRHSVIWLTWSGLRPAPRGGFAPSTPSKIQTKTFLRRKNKQDSAHSRWSGSSRTYRRETEENLPEPASARQNNFRS